MQPGMGFRELVERSAVPPADCFPARYGVLYHGVGLADEYPTLPHASDWTDDTSDGVLVSGMVLCVESYIARLGGREGVKIEEQVLVTGTGNKKLSRYPLDTGLMGNDCGAPSVFVARMQFLVVEQNVGDDGCRGERAKDAEDRQQNLFGHDKLHAPLHTLQRSTC